MKKSKFFGAYLFLIKFPLVDVWWSYDVEILTFEGRFVYSLVVIPPAAKLLFSSTFFVLLLSRAAPPYGKQSDRFALDGPPGLAGECLRTAPPARNSIIGRAGGGLGSRAPPEHGEPAMYSRLGRRASY